MQFNNKNSVIISAAGSRKTTYIIEESIANSCEKSLILTYTIENMNEIRNRIISKLGCIPSTVFINTWFSFLLRECVRPYQNYLYDAKRIDNILFVNTESAPRTREDDIRRHYIYKGNKIYTDKISKFIIKLNEKSEGLVFDRIERVFKAIYIDEIQDLASWDLEILKIFFKSNCKITLVGDNRQSIYVTHHSNKNKQFRSEKIFSFFKKMEQDKLCKIQFRNKCYRCNQYICDFADALYPMMPKTISCNTTTTDHDGVFMINKNEVKEYYKKFTPKALRYSKVANTLGLPAINFGISKGQTYERVLVFPTSGIKKFIKTGNIIDIGDIPKFYVAITRAIYSVAIVYDGEVNNTIMNLINKKSW